MSTIQFELPPPFADAALRHFLRRATPRFDTAVLQPPPLPPAAFDFPPRRCVLIYAMPCRARIFCRHMLRRLIAIHDTRDKAIRHDALMLFATLRYAATLLMVTAHV